MISEKLDFLRSNSKLTAKEKRVALETTVRKKRECEKKALSIVEYMVENLTVDPQWLKNNAQFINPSYYQDVEEERSISKQCGFPLCPNKIEKIWKQKYSIRLNSKKVYDLTHRKNFCSDVCFSASTNFKEQLLTSPLWTRESEDMVEFKVDFAPVRGLPGDEVEVASPALPDDEEEEEVVETVPVDDIPKKPKRTSLSNTENIPSPETSVFGKFEKWITPKTISWLHPSGEAVSDVDVSIGEKLNRLDLNQVEANSNSANSDDKSSLDTATGRQTEGPPLQHLPSVKAFFSGQMEYVVELPDEGPTETIQENPEDMIPINMPLTYEHSLKTLRKKIVMDYVEKWFPRLTSITGLEFRLCQHDLNELVSTFNLTADTVTFRANEVPLLCLLLTFMLSTANKTVKTKLTEEPAQTNVSQLLLPYGKSASDLECYVSNMGKQKVFHS